MSELMNDQRRRQRTMVVNHGRYPEEGALHLPGAARTSIIPDVRAPRRQRRQPDIPPLRSPGGAGARTAHLWSGAAFRQGGKCLPRGQNPPRRDGRRAPPGSVPSRRTPGSRARSVGCTPLPARPGGRARSQSCHRGASRQRGGPNAHS